MVLRRVNQREFRTAVKAQLEGLSVMAGKEPLPYGAHIPVKRGPRKPSGKRSEADVNDEIRNYQHHRPDLKLWRNNRGAIETADGWIRYGVGGNGASDWIGFQSIRITQEMVGKIVAVFVAVEAKAPLAADPTDDQIKFIDHIQAAGGKAGVARSDADVEEIVDG